MDSFGRIKVLELNRDNILELIPKNGILIKTILKKLGISVKEDKIRARRVIRILKKLEKEGKIRQENKSYFLIS